MHARNTARLFSILALLATTSAARAGLVFESETTEYAVSSDGTLTAAVKVYIAQEDGTTLLSDEGGINSAGLQVVTVGSPTAAPTLQSVTKASAFTTFTVGNVTGGKSLYVEFGDLDSGSPVDALGRVLIGTFTYAGFAGVDALTQFRIEDKSGDDTFTSAGTSSIDALIGPGTFTVSAAAVPEPGSSLILGATTLACLTRRRSRSACR